LEQWRAVWARAASQGAHPGDQHRKREGLGEVVVGAEGQTVDFVALGGGGGEHDHPGRIVARAEAAAHLVSVHAGQVAVEHDDVVAGEGGPVEGIATVEGHVGGDALTSEAFGDQQGQLGLILDDKHTHGSPRRLRSYRRAHNRRISPVVYGRATRSSLPCRS
jgi:hypothetical protein